MAAGSSTSLVRLVQIAAAESLERRARREGAVAHEAGVPTGHLVPQMHAVAVIEGERARRGAVLEQATPGLAAHRIEIALGVRALEVAEVTGGTRQTLRA